MNRTSHFCWLLPGSCPALTRLLPGSNPAIAQLLPSYCPAIARLLPSSCPAHFNYQINFCFQFCFQIEVSFNVDIQKYSALVEQQLTKPKGVHLDIMATAKSHLDSALPDLVRELGYPFTASVEQCRSNLRQLVGKYLK
jgi:hypothetical protein